MHIIQLIDKFVELIFLHNQRSEHHIKYTLYSCRRGLTSASCFGGDRTKTMSARSLCGLTSEELNSFVSSFDTVLTDCDGVLWLDTAAIEGSAAALDLFRSLGKRIFYVTNNSTKSRDEFVVKCQGLGFKASKDEILSTAYLTACYLKDIDFKGKAYVVGSKGITQELDSVGVKHTDVGPENYRTDLKDFLKEFKRDPDVTAVIVGYDEHFNYLKMIKAASYLKDPKCLFIGTNTDERFPTKTDLVVPGTGSIVVSVEKCAAREAFKIGKPSAYVGDALLKHYNVDPKRTLMIGDRGNTDILLGTLCGFKTLLVMTGVTSFDELKDWQSSDKEELKSCVPDFYLDKLGDIVSLVNKETQCSCD